MSATFQVQADASPPTLRVLGEVDLANAGELGRALGALDGAGPVLIDLSAAEYFDSAAIRVVFEHAQRRELRLRVPAGAVLASTIAAAGLDQVVTVER